jgi:hypothetical protein
MGDDKATHARRRLYYPVTVHSEADLRAHLYSYAVIELASNIFLASTITIFGVTNLVIHGNNHKIDGQGKVGCFSIEASSVEMKSLVVSNGKAEMGGGIHVKATSHVSLSKVTLLSNVASKLGGGVFTDGFLVMSDSILDSNKCVDYGGGLCYGGGLFSSAANYATLTNCRIGANIASYAGGGLAISRDAAPPPSSPEEESSESASSESEASSYNLDSSSSSSSSYTSYYYSSSSSSNYYDDNYYSSDGNDNARRRLEEEEDSDDFPLKCFGCHFFDTNEAMFGGDAYSATSEAFYAMPCPLEGYEGVSDGYTLDTFVQSFAGNGGHDGGTYRSYECKIVTMAPTFYPTFRPFSRPTHYPTVDPTFGVTAAPSPFSTRPPLVREEASASSGNAGVFSGVGIVVILIIAVVFAAYLYVVSRQPTDGYAGDDARGWPRSIHEARTCLERFSLRLENWLLAPHTRLSTSESTMSALRRAHAAGELYDSSDDDGDHDESGDGGGHAAGSIQMPGLSHMARYEDTRVHDAIKPRSNSFADLFDVTQG